MSRTVARALRATAALALLASVACGEEPPVGVSSTATPPIAGVGAGETAASAGPGVAGRDANSGGSGSLADAGSMGSARTMDAGAIDAGLPSCRVPDDLPLAPDDADGGLTPDCHDVPRTIITENCIGFCHHSRGAPSGGLNLMSPCVADRLLDVTSRCEGLLYIDSAQLDRSFVLDKLQSEKPRCGNSMPDGWHLPPNQVACMNAWVHAVVRAARR